MAEVGAFSTFTNSSRFYIISPFTTVNSPTISSSQSVCVHVSCRKCGGEITPVCLHVAVYFSKQPQYKQTKDKRKVKPTFYGEVFTSDDVVERIEEIEKEKEQEELDKKKNEKGGTKEKERSRNKGGKKKKERRTRTKKRGAEEKKETKTALTSTQEYLRGLAQKGRCCQISQTVST